MEVNKYIGVPGLEYIVKETENCCLLDLSINEMGRKGERARCRRVVSFYHDEPNTHMYCLNSS